MRIFVLDQGNTTISGGIYEGNELILKKYRRTRRMDIDYELIVNNLFLSFGDQLSNLDGIGISCSAPHLNILLNSIVKKRFQAPIVNVSSNLKSLVKFPEHVMELGEDLIAASQGGFEKYGGNLLIISLGTATTLTYLDSNATLKGASIAPGIGISIQSMKRYAPHLPIFEFSFPKKLLCTDTVGALSSGIFWGHLSMLRAMKERIALEVEPNFKTVICGGNTNFIARHADFIDYFDPDLVMYGVNSLCQLNLDIKGF